MFISNLHPVQMFRYEIFRPRLPYLTLNSTSLPLPFLNLCKKPRTLLPLSLYQSSRPTHELSTHSDLSSIIFEHITLVLGISGGQKLHFNNCFVFCFNIVQHINNKPTVER